MCYNIVKEHNMAENKLEEQLERIAKENLLLKEKIKVLQGRIDFYLKYIDRILEDYNG